jgi:hypothetical protein
LLCRDSQFGKSIRTIEPVEMGIGFIRAHENIEEEMFFAIGHVCCDQSMPDTPPAMAAVDRQFGDVPTLLDVIRLGDRRLAQERVRREGAAE